MVWRKLLLLLSFTFFSINIAFAQSIEKKLIMILPDTSAAKLQNARMSFGDSDDYSYRPCCEPWTVITKSKTYGPFSKVEGKGMAWLFWNVKGRDQYLQSTDAPYMYGPLNGTVDYAGTAKRSGLAYTVSSGDTISYYINGTLVGMTDSSTDIGGWCAFSDKGNVLYAVKKGMWNYLFINGRLLDSSTNYYNRLRIDDFNNYSYSLGNFEQTEGLCNCRCSFNSIPHQPQKLFSPLMKFGDAGWANDDSDRYYGNADGMSYPSCSLYDRPRRSFLKLLTNGKSIFGYRHIPGQTDYLPASDSPSTRICANGNERNLPYSEISLPCIDSAGHYALFGRRGFYMYKNVDGIEEKEPLSKHGVRASPVSIDVDGNTICYYATDDSVFVYENDHLFRCCPSEQFDFQVGGYNVWHCAGGKGQPIFSMDSDSYIVYSNTISLPLLKTSKNYRSGISNLGDVYGSTNEYGYWLLQRTGVQKYDLLVNNRRIVLPPGINFEGPMFDDLAYNFRLTANEFIFYVKDGKAIYRYKITL